MRKSKVSRAGNWSYTSDSAFLFNVIQQAIAESDSKDELARFYLLCGLVNETTSAGIHLGMASKNFVSFLLIIGDLFSLLSIRRYFCSQNNAINKPKLSFGHASKKRKEKTIYQYSFIAYTLGFKNSNPKIYHPYYFSYLKNIFVEMCTDKEFN